MSINIYQTQGYFLSFEDNNLAKQYNHTFCGENTVRGAVCPNCKKPLLKFLTIDKTDCVISGDNNPNRYLHLLFCWTCNVAQGDFTYRVLPSEDVEILEYKKGGVTHDFPYDNYPIFFPAKGVGFKPMEEYRQQLITQINSEVVDIYDYIDEIPDITKPQHQVGGEPLLRLNTLEKFKCSICKENMPLLAAIADDHPDQLSFTGNKYVQVLFFFCRKCSVLGARQFCD